MSTILFDKIVFGPIHSRRLGVSLIYFLQTGNYALLIAFIANVD